MLAPPAHIGDIILILSNPLQTQQAAAELLSRARLNVQGAGLIKAKKDQHGFLNAILHAVYAVPQLSNVLKALSWPERTSLLRATAQVLNDLQTAKQPVSPAWHETNLRQICR